MLAPSLSLACISKHKINGLRPHKVKSLDPSHPVSFSKMALQIYQNQRSSTLEYGDE